jgi:SAM-dependent methyltransferase
MNATLTEPRGLEQPPAGLKQLHARRLHLGCGARFHPACVNVDLRPQHASVLRHDVTQPLPFPSGSFDAVFHSHLLEHVPTDKVAGFIAECRRVLRPGGILRVAVPDLEQIVRLYLQALDKATAGDAAWQQRYEWILLELFDQAARERPGGAMFDFLRRPRPLAHAFALDRLGVDAETVIRSLQQAPTTPLRGWQMWSWFSPRAWRDRLLRWLLGSEYEALQCGRFRRGGEVHRTMYDRYSLSRLLAQAGFSHVRQVDPGDSEIPGWADLCLERDPAGNVLKPDSLFMEAKNSPLAASHSV